MESCEDWFSIVFLKVPKLFDSSLMSGGIVLTRSSAFKALEGIRLSTLFLESLSTLSFCVASSNDEALFTCLL